MTQRDKNNHQERRKLGAGGLAHLRCKGSSLRRAGRHLSVRLCVGLKQAEHGYARSGQRFSQGCLHSLERWRRRGAGGTGARGPSEHGPLERGVRRGHRVGREGCALAGHSGGRAESVRAAVAAAPLPHLTLEASHGEGVKGADRGDTVPAAGSPSAEHRVIFTV